ncbi:hypothetical protein AGOR_G00177330 [Albula goreensis]|uniref:ATP-grasp domain-containing protein n=1 Tax=Albula goreensis TaxID=1534307 RepID=A0A8T3CZX5_9TELE|nr:hypothetical protein AGOR_G00177330 [Albula goreensis]
MMGVTEAGAAAFGSLPQDYTSLQQILLELGLPKTRGRTATPRKDLGPSDMVICVKSTPDKYLPILLEGGRRCPGHMLLCLSSSWLSKSPSQKQPGLFSLHVLQAITFEAGGYTYLDTFNPPCQVTYFLEDSTVLGVSALAPLLGADLDCPTCGSPELSSLTEDVLLTRRLLAQRGVRIPPTLAFSFRPLPQPWPQHPHLTIISAQEKEVLQEAMQEAIEAFLLLPGLQTCEKVLIQSSSSGCNSQESVKVLEKNNKEGILKAALTLLSGIGERESILLTAHYSSVQPIRAQKLGDMGPFNAPDAVRRKLSLRIRATVCLAADGQPQVTQVLCWVERTEAHPRSSPTVLQSLEGTLQSWGFKQQDILSLQQLLKQWAESAMQVISDHQSELSDNERGGAHAQTDLIGVEFSLTEVNGGLHPHLLGLTAHCCGVHSTAFNLLDPNGLDRIVGPILQTMCHRSHCSLMAGKTLLIIGDGGSKKNKVWLTAKKYNIKVVLISCHPDSQACKLVWKFFPYDYRDHLQDKTHAANIAQIVQEQGLKVNGCLTFVCNCSVLLSLVCEELSLFSDSPKAITTAKQKSQTHQHLDTLHQGLQHLPEPSLYATVCIHVDGMENLPQAMKQVGFPCVMKLEYSAGGRSLKLIQNVEESLEFLQCLIDRMSVNPYRKRGFINEPLLMEYLGGQKHVIDLVVYRKKLLAAFVSDCGPSCSPYFQNTSHIMPSNLSTEKETLLATAAYQSCLHCGLENGVYNVDMKMTEQGPKLIEINPRTGGNYLPAWIQDVYGFDIIMAAFLISCDIQPHVWTPEARGFCAGISSPVFQYLRAQENTPSFEETLKSLSKKGFINSCKVTETLETASTAYLNLSSFSTKKEEVFHRLMVASQMLGLDSEEYPVKYLLSPLM